MRTLPEWMLAMGESIDAARKLLRQRPDLKSLGTQCGPTRMYGEDEARQIVEALRAWRATKRDSAPAVAG